MTTLQFSSVPARLAGNDITILGVAGGFTFRFKITYDALVDANAGMPGDPIVLFHAQESLFLHRAQKHINAFAKHEVTGFEINEKHI